MIHVRWDVDKLDLLYKLSGSLRRGNSSKKGYNHIVELLDLLLKKDAVKSDYVKQYYSYMS